MVEFLVSSNDSLVAVRESRALIDANIEFKAAIEAITTDEHTIT
jgi:hypothetical protein